VGYLTLHEKAVRWLVSIIPKSKNNHYTKEVRINGLIPDIISKNKIHEVEVVTDKSKYSKINRKKILWIFIPSFRIYDEINLVGEEEGKFYPFSKRFPSEAVEFLNEQIIELKAERNRLLKEKEELSKQVKSLKELSSKVLYLLPSFIFKEDLSEDVCALCPEKSDIVIYNKKLNLRYGLCKRHFQRLLIAEQ